MADAPKLAGKVVIVVTPPADNVLLSVHDAMTQVLDYFTVAAAAQAAQGLARDAVIWRLESATTNSPFRVVAVQDVPRTEDLERVDAAQRDAMLAFQAASSGEELPSWLDKESARAMRAIFERSATRGTETQIQFINGDTLSLDITPAASNTAVESLAAVSEIPEDIPERLAYGDINGQLISVGRYYRKPAFQVLNNLYGSVWCVVARNLMDELGDESTIKDVWEGKSVIVSGVLHYGPGGKLRWLDAHSLRGVARPVISLDSVLDPDFTAGMDPVDYLDKLHEGELG